MRHDTLPAWLRLRELANQFSDGFDLREAFVVDPHRFDSLSFIAPHMRADLSKQLWTTVVRQALFDLAEEVDLVGWRDRLFAGEPVNTTEKRSVDHTAWRRAAIDKPPASLERMLALAERIRSDSGIDDVVHIGIGGSGLGPELAVQALSRQVSCRQRIHVVSNLDGHDLQAALDGLDANRTLFVVVSKSWSTADTLRNAASAMAWFEDRGGADPARHFVAVSARPDQARASGMGEVLDMPEGMGGRFSLWSTVGLPLAIAIGRDGFTAFLRGGAEMDAHFAEAPAAANLPLCMGLLDVWNATFLGFAGRCVVPYHHNLRRLPAYLQQLEMESNGKRVDRAGQALAYATAGVVWGEEGSNGQHAFFQWLHQGTASMPTEIIAVRKPAHGFAGHHEALLANALAQAQALMIGARAGSGQLTGHQDFPGNRPSSFLMLESLDPASFGALLALFEHRVFVAGVVWGVNSFDQWGVELGKSLARDIEPRLASGDTAGLDASTAGLIGWARGADRGS